MKNSILPLAVLASSAAAAPFRQAQPNVVRRDAQVVTVYVTATEGAVQWNDQFGSPYTTAVEQFSSTTTSSSTTSTTSSSTSAVVPVASGSGSTTQPTDDYDEGDDSGSAGYTIAYSPYHANHDCKTQDEVDADMDEIASNGYSAVRMYGTDCGQVEYIVAAAKRNSMTIFAGIYDPNNAADEAQALIDGVNAVDGDWSRITAVSVGNEEIARTGSAGSVVAGINAAKPMLQAANFTGPVTTVDVWVTLKEYLSPGNDLCNAIDVIAANCHPFFDGSVTAEDAGEWVAKQANDMATLCGDELPVYITESGWPSQGLANYDAVPSTENQRTVVDGLHSAFANNKDKLIILSAFDDGWKTDNQWKVEHYWGVYGQSASP